MLNLLFFAVFGAISLSGILLWTKAIQRLGSGTCIVDPLGRRDPVGSPVGLLDVFLIFFAWFGGQLLAAGMALYLLNIPLTEMTELEGEKQASFLGLVGLGQLVLTMGAWGAIWVRNRFNLDAIAVQPKHFVTDVLIGFAAFVMVIPLILLVQWVLTLLVPYEHASLNMLTKDASLMTFVSVWFTAGLVAPITEEVVFRGVIQAWLQRLGRGRWNLEHVAVGGWDGGGGEQSGVLSETKPENEKPNAPVSNVGNVEVADEELSNPYASPKTGALKENQTEHSKGGERSWVTDSYWPIFATAGVFAFMHLGQGAAPVPLFIFACALGYLYKKTGSILPCIVLHLLLNVFSLFWYTINLFYGEVAESMISAPKEASLLDFWIW